MHDFDKIARENKRKERDTIEGRKWQNCLSLEPNEGIVLYGKRKMSRSPRIYFARSHYSSDDKFIHGGATINIKQKRNRAMHNN